MKKIIFLLLSLFLVTGNMMAQSSDPCEELEVLVDQMNSTLPIKVGDICTLQKMYIEDDYVVEVYIYHDFKRFEEGFSYRKSYKKSLLKNWCNDKLLKDKAKRYLACGKKAKFILKHDKIILSFEIVFTEEDLKKIAYGK